MCHLISPKAQINCLHALVQSSVSFSTFITLERWGLWQTMKIALWQSRESRLLLNGIKPDIDPFALREDRCLNPRTDSNCCYFCSSFRGRDWAHTTVVLNLLQLNFQLGKVTRDLCGLTSTCSRCRESVTYTLCAGLSALMHTGLFKPWFLYLTRCTIGSFFPLPFCWGSVFMHSVPVIKFHLGRPQD